MKEEIISQSEALFKGIEQLIETARRRVAVFVNAETTMLYWQIGDYINRELLKEDRGIYGAKILATVSQDLMKTFGKGYSYSALTRMCKVAKSFDFEIVATLSQQLSWSHFIELGTIENPIKKEFYSKLCIYEKWNVRSLRDKIDSMVFERTAISSKPEQTIKLALSNLKNEDTLDPELVFRDTYVLDFLNLPQAFKEKDLETALLKNLQQFIMELGNGFAFLERQKRIAVDSVDYHLDLLFYHRKLKRLVAIDLKLGKFKPEHKAQMELYLRWLQKK
ncbi:PDDEXK nuclease domain-containing protein [Algoriphagus boritolerans]|uniref:PDDEXK nuclease domain-containing protein n=1 Tax=Algoriphagus boritolerans TaxID=308111 RepID=UPI000AE42F64